MPLATSKDVVRMRQKVSEEMKALGQSATRITRFATAVSEIARNTVVHGGGGEGGIWHDPKSAYLLVECRDRGAGIEDLDRAMEDGFSTAGSLGRGLGGAQRLSAYFEVRSSGTDGTRVRLGARL